MRASCRYNPGMDKNVPYAGLTPDVILNAIDSTGIRTDGRLFALNSYENRVYQVGIEDDLPLVGKFYRPGRWTDALPWQPGGRAAARARREKADATIARVGLTPWRDARAIDLGYAEQKFLSLARILVTDASLWLLDEPASGLDPASYDRFVKLVRGRLSVGITICLIEHNLDIVHGISDRIAFLDQGTVLAAGEPRAILNDPKLAAIYFGERR